MGSYCGKTPLANQFFDELSGTTCVSVDDPLWTKFYAIKFDVPFRSSVCKEIEDKYRQQLQKLADNNSSTKNFRSLIQVYLKNAEKLLYLKDINADLQKTANILLVIRFFLKYVMESGDERVLKPFFLGDDRDLMKKLIASLLHVVTYVQISNQYCSAQIEGMAVLLLFLSVHRFSLNDEYTNAIYSYLFTEVNHSLVCDFTACLLYNFSVLNDPSHFPVSSDEQSILYKTGSLIASGVLKILTIGFMPRGEPRDFNSDMVAVLSVHILLVLGNYSIENNPYRLALTNLSNRANVQTSDNTSSKVVDFDRLCKTISATACNDQSTLLLYLLVYTNNRFKSFVLSRSNFDQVVIPVLRVIYCADSFNSYHIYVSLVVLLILTEEEFFNSSVQMIMVKTPSWFTERCITEISLGNLILLVLIKAMRSNSNRLRDRYLHNNCLGAIGNMSSAFRDMHPHAAQSFVSLLALLAKKRSKFVERIQMNDLDGTPDMAQEIDIIEEMMRILLEIMNSILINALQFNSNLIYAMLYSRQIFEQCTSIEALSDVAQNLNELLNYFSRVVEDSQGRSTEYVKAAIESAAKTFSTDKFLKFPELKFKYVEESQSEGFFVPYVWTLIYEYSNIHWKSETFKLFTRLSSNC